MRNRNTFEEFKDDARRRGLLVTWLSRVAFGSSTFRMLAGKISPEELRFFFQEHLGDCRKLARCKDQLAYDKQIDKCIRALIRLKPNIKYGHAAKCASIYVKAAVISRDVLANKEAARLRRFAHVPVDKFVLRRVWDDFGKSYPHIPIQKTAALKSITPRQFHRFQTFLRDRADDYRCHPLDYDLAWADREPEDRRRIENRRLH